MGKQMEINRKQIDSKRCSTSESVAPHPPMAHSTTDSSHQWLIQWMMPIHQWPHSAKSPIRQWPISTMTHSANVPICSTTLIQTMSQFNQWPIFSQCPNLINDSHSSISHLFNDPYSPMTPLNQCCLAPWLRVVIPSLWFIATLA